jgi:uncharacterized protein DUF6399/IclR-like helix-turn-helix domain-containing protein
MGFWAKSLRIFNSFCDNAKQSIRQVAHQTGLSKSSVHRLKQAMERRDTYPESWWWETAEGRCWCIRLVVATLYTFGLKRGVGAETLSEFFGRLHLETQMGCSPSALRGMLQALEHVILETAAAWEHEGIATSEGRPVIGAVDETFLERMMLVFMDLVSGYLLFEEVAEDRSYDTWHALVEARLKALGVGGLSLVSDRAKALIKLAETGQECQSVPDLFHLIHELVKSYALAIGSRLRQARQARSQAQEHLAKRQACEPGGTETALARGALAACEAEVSRWESVHGAYRRHLEAVSLIVHPWRVADSTPQTAQDVERQLHAEIDALEALMETNGLPVKKKALDKVRRQLADLSALVDLWWQGVWQDGEQVVLTPRWTSWIAQALLPLQYWREAVSRTSCPRRKAKLMQALEAVQTHFDAHPVTQQLGPDVLESWLAWGAEHAKAFQRASSAIEGRNGYLSQMHHNHRGLPQRRYPVWTRLYNFDCRASDGTTPASRFFRRDFPDLFETVLAHIEELPRPRERKQALALSH